MPRSWPASARVGQRVHHQFKSERIIDAKGESGNQRKQQHAVFTAVPVDQTPRPHASAKPAAYSRQAPPPHGPRECSFPRFARKSARGPGGERGTDQCGHSHTGNEESGRNGQRRGRKYHGPCLKPRTVRDTTETHRSAQHRPSCTYGRRTSGRTRERGPAGAIGQVPDCGQKAGSAAQR